MSKSIEVFAKFIALLSLSMLVFSAAAFALENSGEAADEDEQTQEETASQNTKQKFEKVQVTGSLIRRADFEGPSPIQIIDRKALDETSYNSVADYVRDLPISSFGASREASGSTAAGVAGINLRGLGESNTLVLLNGARLPIDGNAGFVNMNTVPEIAIDSTEILKDGASATYGSDAIGGVVALKSRKDFTGVEASFRQTITEEPGGERTDVGVIAGKQFGSFGPFTGGSFTAAAQYRFNQRIFDADREWSEPDDIGVVGWSPWGPTPNYQNSAGNWTFIADDCNGITIDDGDDQFCGYPFAEQSTSLPEIQQVSTYLNAELEMGSRNRISTTALVSRQLTEWQYAPSPGGPWVNFVIPAGQAGTIYQGGPLPGTTGTDPVPFSYRTTELGNRVTETSNDSYYIYSEFTREFGETWQWKTSASYSSNDKNAQSPTGYALVQGLVDAVAGGFNPFDPNADPTPLLAAAYQPFQITTSNSVVADTNANGELWTSGNMVLAGAFGAQYIHSEFRDRVDDETAAGTVFGSAGSNGFGQRDVGAAYTELAFSLGKLLEVQAAGRFDSFSDFGEAFSPKIGVKIRPLDSLMFRASFGKAFKAPSLLTLYRSDSIGNPSFIDHVKCDQEKANGNPNHSSCRESQYNVLSGGNPNLEEERATSWGAGFIYEPIRGLAISSDYWLIDQTNLIGIDYEEMTKAEQQGIDTTQFGVIVDRDPVSNSINQVIAPALNLSSRTQSGVDVSVSYTFDTSFGKFRIADNHSQVFEVKQSGFPGVARRDYLDDYGNPEWRNNLSLTYAPNRKHSFGLIYNSVAGQKTVDRSARISSYGELEFTYNTLLPWWKGTTLTAGVKNITGETPPWDPNGGTTPFNEELYSQVQRYGYINLRHVF